MGTIFYLLISKPTRSDFKLVKLVSLVNFNMSKPVAFFESGFVTYLYKSDSTVSSQLKLSNTCQCQWNSIFKLFNNKNFFRPIWSVNFWKNVFIFQYSYMIKLRIIFLISYPKINIYPGLYFNRLQFNSSMTCIVEFNNCIT